MSDKKNGEVLNFLTYQNKESKKYCGICVELGLYDEAENLETLRKNLTEAASGYVRTVMKENLSPDLLQVNPTVEQISVYREAIKSLRPRDTDKPSEGVYSDDIAVFTKPIRPLVSI